MLGSPVEKSSIEQLFLFATPKMEFGLQLVVYPRSRDP